MRHRHSPFPAFLAVACLLAGACAPNLKDVKSTLEESVIVGIAYRGNEIALLDTSLDGRFGLRPSLPVPEAYQAVGRAVRDAFRAEAPGARVDLADPDSDIARAAADVWVRVTVEGAYFCEGGIVRRQTCVLSMRANVLIEDHHTGTNTALAYDVARRSGKIPDSHNWVTISIDQAQRAVPPSSLAAILADDIRQDLVSLLGEPQG